VRPLHLSDSSKIFRRATFVGSVICVVANLALACSAKGTNDGFESTGDDAGHASDGSSVSPKPIDADTPSSLLATSPNCPLSLFEPGTAAQDFSNDASIAADWMTNFAAPQPSAGGSLQFGPHPMSDNWWENYSPITSLNKPGDVLICARLRLSPDVGSADAGFDGGGADADTDYSDSNSFEITVRLPDDAGYETAGMALEIQANASQAVLHTRTGADSWITHDTVPFTVSGSAIATVDIVLFAQGSDFFAQARNVDTGQLVNLHADYNLPAGGAVSLLGWRERAPTFVDRIVIGVPAPSTLPQLQ